MQQIAKVHARAFTSSRVPVPHSRRSAVLVRAEVTYVQPTEVKALVNDKGYTFVDLRTPEEHAEGAKRYFKNMPIALMSEKGPRMNNRFKPDFQEQFPNKMSRVIVACDDGTDRTELAVGIIDELGYSSVKAVEGGVLAVLDVDPLDSKDKAPKWRLVGQTSGVRYAYNDGGGFQKGDVDDGA